MRHRTYLISCALHSALLLMWLGQSVSLPPEALPVPSGPPTRLVLALGGAGSGTSGGSGGPGGPAPSDAREKEPIVVSASLREKPLAPRLITLRFGDDLDVPDLPADTELMFGPAWSDRAVPDPGLGVHRIVGAPPPPSAGRGTGVGGGDGAGVGSGEGHGVGEGPYDPGTLDRLPELVYRPDDPPYPKRAIEAGVRGEVILRIQVNPDGTTTVLSTLRTVPHCVALAWRLAEQYRWKPGVKDGRAVATTGIIIVHFELDSIRR